MSLESIEFKEFPKMARLSRTCIITEKIDGTNAQIFITPDGEIYAGSRTRWLTVENDNFGFCRWVEDNRNELLALGPGRHFGEWWGSGIQRGYGLRNGEKRFSLFNSGRWHGAGKIQIPELETMEAPACVRVVPVLHYGEFTTDRIESSLESLQSFGSFATDDHFGKPEGIVIYHIAAGVGFKKTLEKDSEPKSKSL